MMVTQRRHRVVAALLVRDGRVLMCHRRSDREWYPDVWDFPGGHVEAGETAQVALRREVREELGIRIRPPFRRLARWVSVAEAEDISFFHVRTWSGTPVNLATEEHDAIGWFSFAEAVDRRLPDARYPWLLARVLG
jgi:8-oxo-dGTP diphosphatase